jgi:hypothetical protein
LIQSADLSESASNCSILATEAKRRIRGRKEARRRCLPGDERECKQCMRRSVLFLSFSGSAYTALHAQRPGTWTRAVMAMAGSDTLKAPIFQQTERSKGSHSKVSRSYESEATLFLLSTFSIKDRENKS